MERFEQKGVWWFPAKPEDRFSGTLRFEPETGTELDALVPRELAFSEELDIILGTSSSDEAVTLVRCFIKKRVLSTGLCTVVFFCNRLFIGAHFPTIQDIRFSSSQIRFYGLEKWTNQSGFQIQYRISRDQVFMQFQPPSPIELDIKENCKLILFTKGSGVRFTNPQTEFELKQVSYFELRFAEEVSYDNLEEIHGLLRDFLVLGIGHPVPVLQVKLFNTSNKVTVNEIDVPQPIKVFFGQYGLDKIKQSLDPRTMRFSLSDLQENYAVAIASWFEKAELLESAIGLYFGTINRSVHVQFEFLSLMQALESYNRRLRTFTEVPKEEHKLRFTKILESVPAEYVEWLKEKLKYSNEPSLRNRLKMIIAEIQKLINPYLDEEFVDRTIAARNYYTHYDEALKKRVRKIDLHRLCDQIRTILEICFLLEIGIPNERVQEMVRRYDQWYRWLLIEEKN